MDKWTEVQIDGEKNEVADIHSPSFNFIYLLIREKLHVSWDSGCTFNTGNNCTFKTDYYCTFDTGENCTFKTGGDCTFKTGYNCIFHTGKSCTFKTFNNCTFKTGISCTFYTCNNCTFLVTSISTQTFNNCDFGSIILDVKDNKHYILNEEFVRLQKVLKGQVEGNE